MLVSTCENEIVLFAWAHLRMYKQLPEEASQGLSPRLPPPADRKVAWRPRRQLSPHVSIGFVQIWGDKHPRGSPERCPLTLPEQGQERAADVCGGAGQCCVHGKGTGLGRHGGQLCAPCPEISGDRHVLCLQMSAWRS